MGIGAYNPIIGYLKQTFFQNRGDLFNPRSYMSIEKTTILGHKLPTLTMQWNLIAPLLMLLLISLGGWGLDAFVRTKLKYSQVYALHAIISFPVAISITLLTFYLSEKYLLDKINWNAAIICVSGIAIAAYGAQYLLK